MVLPSLVRRQLGLQKGQLLYIKSVSKTDISLTTEAPVDRYYGILKGAWDDEDAVSYQRRVRNDELERRV